MDLPQPGHSQRGDAHGIGQDLRLRRDEARLREVEVQLDLGLSSAREEQHTHDEQGETQPDHEGPPPRRRAPSGGLANRHETAEPLEIFQLLARDLPSFDGLLAHRARAAVQHLPEPIVLAGRLDTGRGHHPPPA